MATARKATDYPECPECESDVFVSGRQGKAVGHYRCHLCAVNFYAEE